MKAIGLFLVTALVWVLTYLPLILVSVFAVPVMLLFGWEGYNTWFGNYKYGRYGNKAAPSENFWDEYVFLVVRNPISNFGKRVMSVKSTASWPWHYEPSVDLVFGCKFGWKLVKNPEENTERTFVFRPYIRFKKEK